jgi:hypothetical protein
MVIAIYIVERSLHLNYYEFIFMEELIVQNILEFETNPESAANIQAVQTLEDQAPPIPQLAREQEQGTLTVESVETSKAAAISVDHLTIANVVVAEEGNKQPSERIDGTINNDLLFGSKFAEVILAKAGDDLAFGNFGDDTINGGAGFDELVGGGDNDRLIGGDDNDTLFGDSSINDDPNNVAFGDDTLLGGTGRDLLAGGLGNDSLDGGADNDNLNGGEGSDIIQGKSGSDSAKGGTGNDSIFGGAEADLIFGEEDDDLILGGTASDQLFGDRSDRKNGNRGNDTLVGEAGNDTLVGGGKNDSLDGGIGADRLVGVESELAEFDFGFSEIDTLTGGAGKDVFVLGENDVVYYNDGNPQAEGRRDYALITDFVFNQDKLEFAGSLDDYSLGNTSGNLPSGLGVYYEGDGAKELVAILEDVSPVNRTVAASTVPLAKDLTVEFGDILKTPTTFPQEAGRLKVTVTNQGNQKVTGEDLNLYASTDTVLDLNNLNSNTDINPKTTDINALQGTDELLGTIEKISLDPGASRTFTLNFANERFRTASVVSPGAYNLIGVVDANNTIVESNESNNRDVKFISADGTDVVLDWDSVFLNAVQARGEADRNNGVKVTESTVPGVAPPLEAAYAATMSIAVYDAVNALSDNPGSAYLENLPDAPDGASQQAAAVGAAFRVLTELFPEQKATFIAQRNHSLAEINDDPIAETAGFNFGRQVAAQILEERSNDGSDIAQVPYTPGTGPGDYPEANENGPVNAVFANWGKVTPFAIDSVASFRPSGHPAFGSPNYAEDIDEVRHSGGLQDTDLTTIERTLDETEIAQFWAYDRIDTFRPHGQWNQIAQEVALDEGNSLEENARLFAQLNIAMADAGIVAWDAKYVYEQLRPVNAIRGGDTDNNPNTTGDPKWDPLLPTPPFPDYISGHSTFGGAAAGVLEDLFGEDVTFSISSQELPGVSRSFSGLGSVSSFEQAARENANSRLYGGVHVDIANSDGVAIGLEIADFVNNNTFI